MRTSGILITFLVIGTFACKTSQVTSSKAEPYKEDMSLLREDLSPQMDTTAIAVVSESTETNSGVPTGHLKVELDSVNHIIIERNREQRYVDGFTIQIYTGGDREAATEAVTKAAELNPDLDPQIEYHQPSYKVKVGQYLDRLKAHEVFESLKDEFPLALLIPERIQVDYD